MTGPVVNDDAVDDGGNVGVNGVNNADGRNDDGDNNVADDNDGDDDGYIIDGDDDNGW